MKMRLLTLTTLDYYSSDVLLAKLSSKNIARWEPWQISSGSIAPYKAKGWTTITIPFPAFKAPNPTLSEGNGVSIKKFTDLLGASGSAETYLYHKNYATSTTITGFKAAFDNVRVVKIK